MVRFLEFTLEMSITLKILEHWLLQEQMCYLLPVI
jgi:hypothetical protein